MQNSSLPRLMPRPADSHKGTFGHVLLVGGSRGMAGAISLAGMSALRSGAGLVTVATAECCLDTVAGFEPSYMTVPLASDAEGRIAGEAEERICELASRCSAIGCGPGMQRSAAIDGLVRKLYCDLPLPMVVDADALNALAAQRDVLSTHAGVRILTPHPGEFARLVGIEKLDVSERMDRAAEFAGKHRVVLVLKGHRTIVTDGQRSYVNETGNPGMATGGCGDVLTGMITAMIGQPMELPEPAMPRHFAAAALGAYVHGLAGDLGAQQLGQTSLIASDLVRWLPEAFKQLETRRS